MMIASFSEVQCGVDNMWMIERSNGRYDYPNFDGHTGGKYFEALVSTVPH